MARIVIEHGLPKEPRDVRENVGVIGEEVTSLHGATLKHFSVSPNGSGFDVHFLVPLTEVENLVPLTAMLMKLCEIKVTRYSRGLRDIPEEDNEVNWRGIDG